MNLSPSLNASSLSFSASTANNEEHFGDSHLSGFKPFDIVLYLAMYITGHVHTTHSSIALSRCVSGTHPQLGGDELLAVQGQPSRQGAVQRETFLLVSLWKKQGGHQWRAGCVHKCVCLTSSSIPQHSSASQSVSCVLFCGLALDQEAS